MIHQESKRDQMNFLFVVLSVLPIRNPFQILKFVNLSLSVQVKYKWIFNKVLLLLIFSICIEIIFLLDIQLLQRLGYLKFWYSLTGYSIIQLLNLIEIWNWKRNAKKNTRKWKSEFQNFKLHHRVEKRHLQIKREITS